MSLADSWWLILLAVAAIGVAVWLIVGRARAADDRLAPPSAPPEDAGPADIPPSPIAIGPAVAPLDVMPPPLPVVDEARIADAPVAEPAGPPDELTLMKGVGPKLAARLGELGITRFDQIAAWSGDDLARVDAALGAFKGRPARDRWVEQAGYLAAGDRAGFEAMFGKIDPAA